MNITAEILHAKRAGFVKQSENHRALMHSCEGAVQAIDVLLTELAKPEPAKSPDAKPETRQ